MLLATGRTAGGLREQAMTFHEYLAEARRHDAQRVGERDRLIQKARQNRAVRRHHAGPAARRRPFRKPMTFLPYRGIAVRLG
jgi:hypothetical protein